jgi:hypothetical protein
MANLEKLTILISGHFPQQSNQYLLDHISPWRSIFPESKIIISSWFKEKDFRKLNDNTYLVLDKDPGRLDGMPYQVLGNINRLITRKKNILPYLEKNNNCILDIRDDFLPTIKIKNNIISFMDNDYITIQNGIKTRKNKNMFISNSTAIHNPFLKLRSNNPFQISDMLMLTNNNFYISFFANFLLVDEDINKASLEDKINYMDVSLKRKKLSPEVCFGINLANVMKYNYKYYSFESYKDFLNQLSFIDMDDLGVRWLKSSRLTNCIHGYMGRLNPCHTYIYDNNYLKLFKNTKYYMRLLKAINIKCISDTISTLTKHKFYLLNLSDIN